MIEFYCIIIFYHISVIGQRTAATQDPVQKPDQSALKVNTPGKSEKRRRNEVDEDSDLEELLENENITFQGN